MKAPKQLVAIAMILAMFVILCAYGENGHTTEPAEETLHSSMTEKAAEDASNPDKKVSNLDANSLALLMENPVWELSDDGSCYQLINVPYCTNVVCAEYQYTNIYVPIEYIDGGEVNGYNFDTAPIIIQNNCSGWKSSTPGLVNTEHIAEGFVHVNCGARSRDAGEHGKAPSPVVDLKSAIRTLRLNADVIPGDEERIISVGTSGAGQMSSVLGATGNMEAYYSYLYENGAPGIIYDEASQTYTSTINDDIYGCMCYCPIADIENADMAYAWMRFDSGETGYSGMGKAATYSEFQLVLQRDLAIAFCEYINSLELISLQGDALGFDLDANGIPDPRSGSYYDMILQNMSDAINALAKSGTASDGSYKNYASFDEYVAGYTDIDSWLIKNDDGSYTVTDMGGFIRGIGLGPNKDIPGFDTFDLSAENDAFGTSEENAVHYSASVAAVLKMNYERYSGLDGFDAEGVDRYIEQATREDIMQQTYLMNATQIMLACASGDEHADIAERWRTRNGTSDQHTSFTIACNLCLSAEAAGADSVDYDLVWAMKHGSKEGESTGTFAQWVHDICR